MKNAFSNTKQDRGMALFLLSTNLFSVWWSRRWGHLVFASVSICCGLFFWSLWNKSGPARVCCWKKEGLLAWGPHTQAQLSLACWVGEGRRQERSAVPAGWVRAEGRSAYCSSHLSWLVLPFCVVFAQNSDLSVGGVLCLLNMNISHWMSGKVSSVLVFLEKVTRVS